MLRIALISGSPLVLAGLQTGIIQFGGFDVLLSSSSLEDAREASFAGADVAIVDLQDDSDALRYDEEGSPIVLLTHQEDRRVGDLLREGFTVLPRDAPIAMIAAAAQAAAAGLVACTPRFASEALRFAGAVDSQYARPPFEPLTPREREVLAQMSFGLGNREIAEALRISTHTAKFHVAQIISKLAANSRAHAVAKAMRAGLVASYAERVPPQATDPEPIR